MTGDSALRPVPARNNLLLRIISGVALGAIVIWGAVGSNFILNLLLAAGGIVAGIEWTQLVDARTRPGGGLDPGMRKSVLAILPLSLLVLFVIGTRTHAPHYIPELLCGLALLVALRLVCRFAILSLTVAGFAYIGATILSLLTLHQGENWHALVFLLLIVWSTDTFAFAFGKMIGGPKLAPRISPGKTWAGAIGGLLGAIAVAALLYFHQPVALIPQLVAGCLISLLTQVGDLAESALKRHFGVKDSGFLIPGHGGILDRIDGLLLAAPIFTLYHHWMGLGIVAP